MSFTALNRWVAAACLVAVSAASQQAMAETLVQFDTSLGAFQVSLDEVAAPISVANFLSYTAQQSFADTIIHRSVRNFVVQGGGFYTDFSPVPQAEAIANESGLSNLRGTIAMARTADLNSATSQWYINTVDNLALDTAQYAVFGRVLGDGMKVVDAIAALPIYNLSNIGGPVFGEVPLRDVGSSTVFKPEFFVTVSVAVVPEPQTWMLMGLGLAAVGVAARRSTRAPQA